MNSYTMRLTRYLASERGRTTPKHIASMMLKLDPRSVGISVPPLNAQLHATRVALERLVPVTGGAR